MGYELAPDTAGPHQAPFGRPTAGDLGRLHSISRGPVTRKVSGKNFCSGFLLRCGIEIPSRHWLNCSAEFRLTLSTCRFRMYGPPPICKWIFASCLDQSAVMYPAPEHSLWP
jgi:hypothetical protein